MVSVLKLDTQYLGRKENADIDLAKVVRVLEHRFVPKHGTAMRVQEKGTEFVILLDGLASGWVPVPAAAVMEPLEKFFTELANKQSKQECTMTEGFNFLNQESDGEYMTFDRYAKLVGSQAGTDANLETNYSEFMFCVAFFCMARALKNISSRVELS